MQPDPEEELGPSGLLDALVRVSFEVIGLLTKLAADEDLSLTQLRVLAILRDRQPRMAFLAATLGLDRSTITGLIARAEQRGLLARVAAPGDGRSVEVVLTDHGRQLATRLQRQMAQAVNTLTVGLSFSDRERLAELLLHLLPPE